MLVAAASTSIRTGPASDMGRCQPMPAAGGLDVAAAAARLWDASAEASVVAAAALGAARLDVAALGGAAFGAAGLRIAAAVNLPPSPGTASSATTVFGADLVGGAFGGAAFDAGLFATRAAWRGMHTWSPPAASVWLEAWRVSASAGSSTVRAKWRGCAGRDKSCTSPVWTQPCSLSSAIQPWVGASPRRRLRGGATPSSPLLPGAA
mmetsp:Transcript_25606/g.73914  ORF Transcript_25606/g.73914 Transcript_25606/m.73914 type:complete len:207 (+) Transcript_25606:266-886(+)